MGLGIVGAVWAGVGLSRSPSGSGSRAGRKWPGEECLGEMDGVADSGD